MMKLGTQASISLCDLFTEFHGSIHEPRSDKGLQNGSPESHQQQGSYVDIYCVCRLVGRVKEQIKEQS